MAVSVWGLRRCLSASPCLVPHAGSQPRAGRPAPSGISHHPTCLLCLHHPSVAPPRRPFLCRDLTSTNVLVDEHWTAKVADYCLGGMWQAAAGGGEASSTLAALNPRYLAPEVMTGEGSSPASDVFAFG